MSKRVIDDNTLSAIGDAIRAKNGEDSTYTPLEMASAIFNIKSKEYVFNNTDYEIYKMHQALEGTNLYNIYPEKIDFMLVNHGKETYVYIRGICPDTEVNNKFLCYCFSHQPTVNGAVKLGNYIIEPQENISTIYITRGQPIELYSYTGALQSPSRYSIFVLQRK